MAPGPWFVAVKQYKEDFWKWSVVFDCVYLGLWQLDREIRFTIWKNRWKFLNEREGGEEEEEKEEEEKKKKKKKKKKEKGKKRKKKEEDEE